VASLLGQAAASMLNGALDTPVFFSIKCNLQPAATVLGGQIQQKKPALTRAH